MKENKSAIVNGPVSTTTVRSRKGDELLVVEKVPSESVCLLKWVRIRDSSAAVARVSGL